MKFDCVVKIPVEARTAYFEDGQFVSWDKKLEDFDHVDLTLVFEGFPMFRAESEEDPMSTSEVADAIRNADWCSDYTDDVLSAALCNFISEKYPAGFDDMDEDGNGHDGVVGIWLNDDVYAGFGYAFPMLKQVMDDEDVIHLSSGFYEAWENDSSWRDDNAFGADGFEASWFYDSCDGVVRPGSPFDKGAFD